MIGAGTSFWPSKLLIPVFCPVIRSPQAIQYRCIYVFGFLIFKYTNT